MNLCVDQGNSSIKIGIFDAGVPVLFRTFDSNATDDIKALCSDFPIVNCILSSVWSDNNLVRDFLQSMFPDTIVLSHTTPIPVKNLYKTPQTLGKDRLAAVVAAGFLYPHSDLLVIDAGTAITYDFMDSDANYYGGNIAPGLEMRLKSMHQFTQKLPLVDAEKDIEFLGYDTKSALQAGALYGVIFEINGYINQLKFKYPELLVLLTGGSTFYFADKLKNAIFAEQNLVLIGLNRILQYNVQK